MSEPTHPDEPTGLEIAIVGMACRFPGAADADQFWDNLKNGVESIDFCTPEYLEEIGEDPAYLELPDYVRAIRTIDGHDLFDAAFFGISPKEAEVLDPQQRLMLECAWEALERAGYAVESYPGLIGIFAGSRLSSYLTEIYARPDLQQKIQIFAAQVGNDKDYVVTRVSYKLDLGGPSVSVQTACSTSLVATHLACQSLLAGECDMALAGGVSVRAPAAGYLYREGEIYSREGRIRAFDAGADGTIFGNGLGLVVLKRLEDALEDGDQVWAVIKGSAVNNDGAHKVGYTAPGADGQARVIRAAQVAAEVDPATITYVETHGTGTPTGDPIEISALTRAFRETTDEKGFCAIGSVKTNVGHQSAAAGVAGLIKTAYALKHRLLPPSLNFERPNPQIDFAASPFYVQTELAEWPADRGPRRAGVSAFGIGGTNGHVILEEAPPLAPTTASRPWQLVLLSARTPDALEAATTNLARHLREHPELDLADVAFTLQAGRKAFEQRRMLVCRRLGEAAEALAERDPARLRGGPARPAAPSVVFLFSGQGAQYPGMGRGLYDSESLYRELVDRCCELLEGELGRDLRELLHPEDDDPEALEQAAEELAETRFTQPALFVVEYALARLWMSWGLEPAAMLGHSIGEYVAACLAGVFSLEDALRLVAVRGRLMQALPGGSMLSVPLAEEAVRERLDPQLSIAAINAPGRTVVSGPSDAIAALDERLRAEGIASRPLRTSHAFHSTAMEPILPAFVEEVRRVELRVPELPYLSNVTGTWVSDAEATDPEYWALHLRREVRFADGLAQLLEEDDRVLLEVGPGKTLLSLARRHPAKRAGHLMLSSLRHPKDRGVEDLPFLLSTLGQAWLAGVEVDWRGFYAGERRRRLPLPTYPFERRRYWFDVRAHDAPARPGTAARRPRLEDWLYLPAWKPSVVPEAPAAHLAGQLDTGDAAETAAGAAERWLVFLEGEGTASRLGERLAERLGELGREVVRVTPGDGCRRLAAGAWELAPGRPEGYRELLAALAEEEGGAPSRVLHLWSLGGTAAERGLEEVQDRGFRSLLFLVQALGRHGGRPAGGGGERAGLRLAAVSDGLHPRGLDRGGDPGPALDPRKATLLGPCQVLASEYPGARAVSVDVVLPEPGTPAEAELVDALLGELAEEPEAAVVAYREGGRWTRGYEPVRVARAAEGRLPFRRQGVYLITGGLGGFGLTFAEHLAGEYGARLVLAGRSALPARERWDAHLAAHGEDERSSRRILAVRALEAAGAEVTTAAVDVADPEAMAALIASVRERHGALHGVIHAAGVAGGGMMQLKDPAAAEAVIAPKLQGTLALEAALEEALGGEPLDFLVLCSSTIAVLGTFGQVDYCAANAFLDAFAEARWAQGDRAVVSINWGAWRDVGMAVETPSAGLAAGSAPLAELPPEEGEAVDHPLLDRRLDPGEAAALYATDFSAERHWLLDEHRILGTPAVPGTAWLELARAAFADHTGEHSGEHSGELGAELRDVIFFQPLRVGAGEVRRARLWLEDEPAGGFRFRIESRGAGEAEWTAHAQGKVAALAGAERRRLDLEALAERCGAGEEVQREALDRESAFVYWGPRWHCLRRVHAGEGEGLALLVMPEGYEADFEGTALHPAMLDVATALISALGEEENYLPLSYRRLAVKAPLPASFYAHLQLCDGDVGGSETLSADLVLADPEGRELVAIERFTMKKVGAARSRLGPAGAPRTGEPAGAAADARRPAQGGFAEGGMAPAEGVEALRRVLSRLRRPRVVVSPRDLGALLERQREGELELGGEGSPATTVPAVEVSERHPRPALTTPYAEPRDDVERRLCEVWASVLGLEEVGIHDNFFDLGGDSVLGISVLSQAAEAGLELRPEQLFEHQTVAELAAQLAAGGELGADELAPADEEAASGSDPGGDLDVGSGVGSDIESEELEKILGRLQEIS